MWKKETDVIASHSPGGLNVVHVCVNENANTRQREHFAQAICLPPSPSHSLSCSLSQGNPSRCRATEIHRTYIHETHTDTRINTTTIQLISNSLFYYNSRSNKRQPYVQDINTPHICTHAHTCTHIHTHTHTHTHTQTRQECLFL